MNWLEIFGWIGSALVVASLMVANTIKFRTYNLIGCVIATTYNWILGIWPYMAMNAAITIIDAYWLWKLIKAARAEQAEQVATDPA